MSNKKDENHQLFSVKFYVQIFFVLLFMIFLNIGISQLPLPNAVITILLLLVATGQAVLVCLFFMELIHEDKFYSFVWGGAILFMILFFVITLFEVQGRGAFDLLEDVHYMRKVHKNNNYAPGGPEIMNKSKSAAEEKK